MALDIITTLRGDTCVIIQTQSRVLPPDKAANASSLLNHMGTQANTFSNPHHHPQAGGLDKSVVWIVEKLLF